MELAQTQAVPALEREHAARMLGADAATLEDALAGHADDASDVLTRNGLRLDQAAAAFRALTSGRLAELINAPAGSGKTTTATAMARAWERAGQVVGIAPSQAARNTLAKGIAESYNFAHFLGHLPGRRGARGAVRIGPGTLAVADEASMFSTRDLLDIMRLASHGGKLVIAGDTEQLTAVEHGGGMSLLAHELGYAQLFEPVRFRAQWERDASLRLRAGDASVLTDYADHGRLRCAPLEEILDSAAAAYVARALQGRDVLLVVQDHATRRELNRRVRGELRHLGQVDPGRSAEIADKQRASAGDLVVCTQNDNRQPVGDGQTLSNRHLLQVMRITDDGRLVLRRVLGTDAQTGARRLSDHVFTYGSRDRFEPGYAVTKHCAQSRTVRSGMEVITGSEDRQGAYVGLSRGDGREPGLRRDPVTEDRRPATGSRPAPELDRRRRLEAEHQAVAPVHDAGEDALDEGMAVLADVLERDGAELSALEYQQRQLSNADHLGILHAMWQAETWQARSQRYRDMVTAELPPGYDGELSHRPAGCTARCAAPSWPAWTRPRSCATRSARAACRQPGCGQRHRRADPQGRRVAVPLPPLPWAEQVPEIADPETPAVPERPGRGHGRAAGPDRRARRRRRAALGDGGARPGAAAPAGPPCLAGPRGGDRGLPRDVRVRPPVRTDRAGADRRRVAGQARDVARRVPCARARRGHRPAGQGGWLALAHARHLRGGDGLGAQVRRRSARVWSAASAEDAALAATSSDAEADVRPRDDASAERHRQRAAESRTREAGYRLRSSSWRGPTPSGTSTSRRPSRSGAWPWPRTPN